MALRARLNATPGRDWRKAGFIMQEIVWILGHRVGPSRGRINPRACSHCDYFGHTRQWCKVRVVDEARRKVEREQKEAREHDAWVGSLSGVRASPEWVAELEWLNRRYKAACAAGGGCTENKPAECAGEHVPCEACEGCAAWDRAVAAFEAENPRTSETGA